MPQPEVVQTVETDADRLLNYFAYMTKLRGNDLIQEYGRVQDAYHLEPSDFHRMQLVMLLCSPSASFRDTELARFLLNGWLEKEYNTYSKLYPLALLFDTYLTEISSRDVAIKNTTGQLKDTSDQLRELREENQAQDARIAEQKSKLTREEQRSRELQEKLDALLEMEQTLIERGQE